MIRVLPILLAVVALRAQEAKWTYPLPSDGTLAIARDVPYREADGETLRFDLYRPKARPQAPLPVVLFINGICGSELRKAPQYTSWGRAVAGRGVAGVAFDTHSKDIAGDIDALIVKLRSEAKHYDLDLNNVIVYACSSNVLTGLPWASGARPYVKGAVIYYGAAEMPAFRLDLPVFFVRAEFDSPGLLRSIDTMLGRAIAANAPFQITNLAGHHGFEVVDDTALARETIAHTLDFMHSAVSPESQRETADSVLSAAASAALLAEDWPGAIRAFEQIVKNRPGDSEAQRQLGESYLGARQYATALAALRRARDLGNRNRGLIAFSAAICAIRTNAISDAFEWLEQIPVTPGMIERLRAEPAFDALRADPRYPAAAK